MKKTEIDNILKRIASEILEIPADKISDNLNHTNVEQWDSMSHINLIISVEEEFEIEIEEEKIMDLMSFKALSDYVFSVKGE